MLLLRSHCGSACLALSMTLVLTGCGPSWIKPGATPATLQSDSAQCELAAYERFPVVTTTTPVTRWETVCMNGPSLGYDYCNGDDYNTMTIARTAYVSTDQNARPRSLLIDQCMQARGWKHP